MFLFYEFLPPLGLPPGAYPTLSLRSYATVSYLIILRFSDKPIHTPVAGNLKDVLATH